MSQSRITSRVSAPALAAAAVALSMAVAPHAQQPPAQGGQPPAAQAGQKPPAEGGQKPPAGNQAQAPAQKPLVPVVASTLAAKPDAYFGENVTMMAVIERTLAPLAFSVDQDRTKTAEQDVLVLAPRLNEPLELNSYVTVIGEVVKFDPADAKVKDRIAGMAPDMVTRYTGKPAIVATSVINTAMNDIARRLPPKMTPEEEAFQKVMQKVGAANGAFRGIIEKSDAAGAKEQAAALKAAFIATEAFFKPHGKADAIGWAQDARKAAEGIELAAAGGKWDEVKATAGSLGKMCQTCHTAYRERYDDGSFRVKLGGGR